MMLKQLFYGKLLTESNPSFYNSLRLNDFKPDTSDKFYILCRPEAPEVGESEVAHPYTAILFDLVLYISPIPGRFNPPTMAREEISNAYVSSYGNKVVE